MQKNFIFVVLGLIAGALALVIVADLLSADSFILKYGKRREYTNELKQFRNMIQVGVTSKDELKERFKTQGFQYLQLGESAGLVKVSPPLEFGLHNWVMNIGVVSDRVVYVRVRTMKDDKAKPMLAPKDVFCAGYES